MAHARNRKQQRRQQQRAVSHVWTPRTVPAVRFQQSAIVYTTVVAAGRSGR